MRRNIFKTIALSLLAVMATVSCTRDESFGTINKDGMVTLNVTFTDAGTRGGDDIVGTTDDNKVGTLRVMAFRADNGILAVNEYFATFGDPQQVNVLTGSYDFYFIANEHLDPAASAKLMAMIPGDVTAAALEGISFAETAFRNNYPMLGIERGVTVTGNNTIKTAADANPKTVNPWHVSLTRTGIKVRVVIDMSVKQSGRFSKYNDVTGKTETGTVSLDNIPDRVHLLPGKYNDAGYAADPRTLTVTSGASEKGTGYVAYTAERVVLPETLFGEPHDKSKGIKLRLKYLDGAERETTIGVDVDASDYTIPRNHYIGVSATVNDDGDLIVNTITVEDWNNKGLGVSDKQYYLRVSQEEFRLGAQSWGAGDTDNKLTVMTNHPDDWKASVWNDLAGTQAVPNDPVTNTPWLKISPSSNDGSNKMTLTLEENTNYYQPREAYIHITAGEFLKLKVKITQERMLIAPKFARSNIVMYVAYDGTKILTFAEEPANHTTLKIVTPKSGGTYGIPAIAANVEGLHFRWGSLVGISSNTTKEGKAFTPDDIVFHPADYTTVISSWSYDASSATGSDLPPYIMNEIVNTGTDQDVFTEKLGAIGYKSDEGIGDICRYITDMGWVTGKWRIPRQNEYQILCDETISTGVKIYGMMYGTLSTHYVAMEGNTATRYGYSPVPNARMFGAGVTINDGSVTGYLTNPGNARVVLPASGCRSHTKGFLYDSGYQGNYWTTTPTTVAGSYIFMVNSGNNGVSGDGRAWGYSVRCIRDE